MFKQHKTFDLQKERQPKKRDTFYQPKKCKYLKYILPPVLIAFVLFLILINVDFDNEIFQIPQNHELLIVDNAEPYRNFTTFEEIQGEPQLSFRRSNDFTPAIDYKNPRNSYKTLLAAAIKCTSFTANCTLSCTDGSVAYIEEDLESLQSNCPKTDIALMMTKCEFYNGKLQKTFFGGSYKLRIFSLNECNLQSIQDGAFTHANVKNLEKLSLINNQLKTLLASNLEGLTNLKYLEFKQLPLAEEFKGIQILKPMSNTVLEVTIQPAINSTTEVNPAIWWRDFVLHSATHLDISHTNFQNILGPYTFESFTVLETLILFNCNLISFQKNAFDAVANTLKYLDLRLNHLTILDPHFLGLMASKNIKLELGLNEWFCECDYELFEIFDLYNVQFTEEIICSAPEKYSQLNFKQLVMECTTTTMVDTTEETSTEITTTTSRRTSTLATTTTDLITATTTSEISTVTTTVEPSTTTHTSSEISTTTTTLQPTTTTHTSSEISTTTTTLQPTTTTSTSSEISTTTTTLQSSTTTTTVTKTPTPPSPSSMATIKCYTDINKLNSFNYYVVKQKQNFSIYTTSASSVRIEVKVIEYWQKLSVLYFSSYEDYRSINADSSSRQTFSIKGHISITALQNSKAYLYCLYSGDLNNISPYDCQAHFIVDMTSNRAWLLQTDKAWFITISTIVASIMLLSSLFLVYYLLRRHPYWLLVQRNKRILPIHNRPNEILVISKKTVKEAIISLNNSPVSQRSSNYLKALPRLQVSTNQSNAESSLYISQHTIPSSKAPSSPPTSSRRKLLHSDYLKPLPRLQTANNHYKGDSSLYISQHTIPPCKAPITTPTASRHNSPLNCKINLHKESGVSSEIRACQQRISKLDTLSVNDSEEIYQTIDHYEAVNF